MSEKILKRPWFIPMLIMACLGIIYVYPRFLIGTLGPANPWTSFLYMYGFGFITFGLGMWIILAQGSLKLSRGNEKFWYKMLLFGFLFFFSLHGIWVALSLYVPHKPGVM